MKISRNEFLVLALVTALSLTWMNQARAEMLLVPTDNSVRIGDEVGLLPVPPDRVRRMPTWRPPRPTDLPFRVTHSRVDVRIEENIATTTITQSFLNLSDRDLEVRVLIPIPAGAAISKSALSMGDEMVEGRLYSAQEAQSIYESIVNQRRDPALLRFSGENLYEARIFPISPRQERRLQFAYDQALRPIGGMYDFRHILSGSQLYRNGLDQFRFECVIRSSKPLGPVYSPSHTVEVKRPNDRTAEIRFDGEHLATDRDFQLYFAPSSEEVALRAMAHRESAGDDGYFMVLARPDDQIEGAKILSKEVVLVLDTSGSMAGEKMGQARNALTFCLNQFNPQDRFNLVTFSTDVRALSDGRLLPATKENIAKALRAVETLEATGGTDIDGALRAALNNDFSPGADKAKLVIFLTDGRPSVGITDSHSILNDVAAGNKTHRARVFVFGVGTDVNTHLLDKLSLDSDGTSSYVAPTEDLEVKVSDFYAKMKNPVMTDVSLDFGAETRANSIYPRKLPALFKGSELMVFGRYKGTGSSQIVLRGNVAGEQREIRLNVTWPSQERDHAFLPRVWAMRKIGYLLEDIRLRGSNQETIDEIVRLSQRHGIITPYTSQLVLEPGMEGRWRGGPQPVPMLDGERAARPAAKAGGFAGEDLRRSRDMAKKEAGAAGQVAQNATTGDIAVALAEQERTLKNANALASTPSLSPMGQAQANAKPAEELRDKAFLVAADGKGSATERAEALKTAEAQTIRQIGTRTFYLRGGAWVDSTLVENAKPTIVKAFGKEYFELLKKNPDLGSVFALDGRILVMVGGQAFQVEVE
jgi:Ca-activated chloride channel family protein